jgi:hypothetical protein
MGRFLERLGHKINIFLKAYKVKVTPSGHLKRVTVRIFTIRK